MGLRWASRRAAPLAAALVLARGAGPAEAQQASELGIGVIATASDPAQGVGSVYGGLRTSRRMRLSAAAGAGVSDGRATWRGELLAHFLLSPARREGAGIYGGGGIAVVGGPVDQGYVVVTLGLEGRPAGRGGWFVEAGVGGGARLALGYRWRWFTAATP